MILGNLKKNHPFIRFLFAAIITVLALAMPKYKVFAEGEENLQNWVETVDKMMEETAWASIDGKINYMDDITSSDMELYQETYSLSVEKSETGSRTKQILSLEEYVNRESYGNSAEFYGYGFAVKNSPPDSISHIEFDWDEDGTPITEVSFSSFLDEEKVKKWRTWFCIGLYPDLCGIRLGDRYEDVCRMLGLPEKMEMSSYGSGYYYASCDASDYSSHIYLCKGDKRISLFFNEKEDTPDGNFHFCLSSISLAPHSDW